MEQKQAIIFRAVTHGLDPFAPLVASGIPWLGDIPMHWDRPLLGRLLKRIEQGWSPVAAEGELALPEPRPSSLAPARQAAIVDFCHALVNSNEFLYVD